MAKVSNVQSGQAAQGNPVDRFRADADRVERTKDSLGRMIAVKRLTYLDTFDITCMLGEDARNPVALNQALMTASVCEIDGDPVQIPRKLPELRALMKRLDYPGVTAAVQAGERFVLQDDQVDAVKNS